MNPEDMPEIPASVVKWMGDEVERWAQSKAQPLRTTANRIIYAQGLLAMYRMWVTRFGAEIDEYQRFVGLVSLADDPGLLGHFQAAAQALVNKYKL